MPCLNITEIPITYELNGASFLGRDIKECNHTVEGVHDLPDLIAPHIKGTAYGVYRFVFMAAHDHDTRILNTAVHQ